MNGIHEYNAKINAKTNNLIGSKRYLIGFKSYLEASRMAPTTIYDYVSRVNNFMEFTGKTPNDLALDDYTIYIGSLVDKTSSYQILTYSALKKFSLYLKANQINERDPMQYVSRPKYKESAKTKEKRRNGYLSMEEIKEVKNNILNGIGTKKAKTFQKHTKERDMAIVMVFLSTGMRCSALCNLDLDNINYNDQSVVVTDKGGKVRDYYLPNETWNFLMDWIDKRGETENDALFIGKNNDRLGYRSVYNLVKKYAKNIEGKNITPHKLRATYGTQLYNATKDIDFVKECMGHNSVVTTQAYIRGNNDVERKASEIMNMLLTI